MNINPAAGTSDYYDVPKVPRGEGGEKDVDLSERIREVRMEMFTAAENLEFEKAARLRDELHRLEGKAGSDSPDGDAAVFDPYSRSAKKSAKGGRGKAPAKGAAPASKSPVRARRR